MQDQFKPWYFGIAFAFLFKFCTGMPDMPEWSTHPRHRRTDDAPRVDFPLWVRLMSRRVEQHLKRDWLFGFTMCNVLFRSLLNQCRSVYSYENVRRADGTRGFTSDELEAGAISICQALDGKYKDLSGRMRKVNGDFTKVKYATTLNEAGSRLLQNLEHTGRQLKGTMEVRKKMRFETNGGRIQMGTSLFITFSPDEKHNVLMLRMHRSRGADPIHQLEPAGRKWGERLQPLINQDFVEQTYTLEEISSWMPQYDQRRAILSRDALASVEGFKLSILLVCEFVFGLRVCAKCPDCNHCKNDADDSERDVRCQDLNGSNAYSDGGSFGRADGVYISIEAQKSAGSLHAHGQLHVQCLHQHTPLTELLSAMEGRKSEIVAGYLQYKAHVCREEHPDVDGWENGGRRDEIDNLACLPASLLYGFYFLFEASVVDVSKNTNVFLRWWLLVGCRVSQ